MTAPKIRNKRQTAKLLSYLWAAERQYGRYVPIASIAVGARVAGTCLGCGTEYDVGDLITQAERETGGRSTYVHYVCPDPMLILAEIARTDTDTDIIVRRMPACRPQTCTRCRRRTSDVLAFHVLHLPPTPELNLDFVCELCVNHPVQTS